MTMIRITSRSFKNRRFRSKKNKRFIGKITHYANMDEGRDFFEKSLKENEFDKELKKMIILDNCNTHIRFYNKKDA